MTVPTIGEKETAALRAAQKRARAKPITRTTLEAFALPKEHTGVVSLADREHHPERTRPQSEHVYLPTGFRVATGVVSLADREQHPPPPRPQSEHVYLPTGFRVAMSYEDQPLGVCLHLSISVGQPGRAPNLEAVAMILEALDLLHPIYLAHLPWTEEYKEDGRPGGHAINLLIMTAPTPAGHA